VTIAGSLKRLLVWILILSIWEGAFRTHWFPRWESFVFPAPSHVVDGFAGILGWNTEFGRPLGKDWPFGPPPPPATVGSSNLFFSLPSYIGIRVTEQNDGLLVNAVTDSSPAARSGLKVGDVIVELNSVAVRQVERLESLLAGCRVGDKAGLKVLSGRNYRNLTVTFERPVRRPLLTSSWVSLARLGVGFSLSLVLGTLLGAAMWRFRAIDEFLGPLFLGLQTLPSVCWAPLAILLFGLQEPGVLFVLVMGSFFAIAIALRDGLRIIPPLYQRAGLMLGAGGWRLYRYVLLPASLPAVATSLRQGFSFSWRSLMGAELMLEATQWKGLGALLGIARSINDSGRVVAIMIVMVLLGMAADRLIFGPLQRAVQRRFGLEGR
jgi:NitT/TauT family transport system permease protein